MIVPSIDLQDGNSVQLIGGKELAIDAGDPRPLATRFGLVGEVAVIDLDAALGVGSNADTIEELLGLARCRVGGGIRSYEAAVRWLDAGAEKIIIGTAADPELLSRLPKDRIIAALDAYHGEVVDHGWTNQTGRKLLERITELAPYVGGFLVTFVEREGRMQGIDLEQVRHILAAAGKARVTIAGGVTTGTEIQQLDWLGADAQVGMALYTNRISLAEAVAAPLRTDREDGLWPTVVVDEHGVALGLCWSNWESLYHAIAQRRGVYWSRMRGLWHKGETSGAIQELLAIDLDCDRDALRFTVRQSDPGFCHLHRRTCWGEHFSLTELERTISKRMADAPSESYTKKLLENPDLLRSKIIEEAIELMESGSSADANAEAADLFYFALVALAAKGGDLYQVAQVLNKRAKKLTRRPGEAKSNV